MSLSERQARKFSDTFKLQKVKEIETGRTKPSDVCRQYEVSSTNVYRWINKFGSMKNRKERLIVESQSDTQQLLALKKQVAELERIIGQKQVLLDFKDKMIELAEEAYGVDIKKKFSTKPSGNSGNTGKDTLSV